jgi:hypothetical protein
MVHEQLHQAWARQVLVMIIHDFLSTLVIRSTFLLQLNFSIKLWVHLTHIWYELITNSVNKEANTVVNILSFCTNRTSWAGCLTVWRAEGLVPRSPCSAHCHASVFGAQWTQKAATFHRKCECVWPLSQCHSP